MAYLLDSDTLIAAKNEFYRFNFCPGYWDWILRENTLGKVFIIDRIRDELTKGNDDLVTWVKSNSKQLSISTPEDVSNSLTIVSKWASSQRYMDAAVNSFLSGVDYYLIAYAHSLKYTVVTREVSQQNSLSRIKIPDVCRGIGVMCITPFQMLEDEKARFVLDS